MYFFVYLGHGIVHRVVALSFFLKVRFLDAALELLKSGCLSKNREHLYHCNMVSNDLSHANSKSVASQKRGPSSKTVGMQSSTTFLYKNRARILNRQR